MHRPRQKRRSLTAMMAFVAFAAGPAGPALAAFDITPTSATVTEGRSQNFRLTNDCVPPFTCHFEWTTRDGTAVAGADYEPSSGTADFNIATPRDVTITTKTDGVHEYGPESLSLDVVDTGDNNRTKTATLTINDADRPPTVEIVDASANEGAGEMTFTLRKPQRASQAISVPWATANESAGASDYTPRSGTVQWDALDGADKSVTVPITADTLDEQDESLVVNLSTPSNASLSDPQARGTILDDDAPPTVSIADATVNEGNSGTREATMTVSLSNPSAKTVTVDYATAVGGTALPGFDFLAKPATTLTFAPGETSKTAVIQVLGDTEDEGQETIRVDLVGASNATIADGDAILTLVDDDTLVPDLDADGFNAENDCNDASSAMHPGARDAPDNGIDEDCDGRDAINLDRDDDGFSRPVDCRDDNAKIHPNAIDTPGNRVDEDCSGAAAPYPLLDSTIGHSFRLAGRNTVITSLYVRRARAGSTVRVRCTGRGCPFRVKRRKVRRDARLLRLSSLLRKAQLRPGARLEVRVTKPSTVGVVSRFTIAARKKPARRDLCLKPGARRPSRCSV